MDRCKEWEEQKWTKEQNPRRPVIWRSGHKKDGSWGWENEGMSPSISTTSSLCFFLLNTFFSHHQQAISNPQCTYMRVCVCVCVCLSECVLEVMFGVETIKALLKYKQKEREKKRSETVREGAHTQRLSWSAQQSTGSLSILWAQRCEMSQQPNSNIKLSWAVEGKSRMERCLLLTLSPSPDLHFSKPFKNRTL